MCDTGKHIIFYFRLTRKDGSIEYFEIALDKKDSKKIDSLRSLLLKKSNVFMLNDMKIAHYKNNIFLISIGK